MLPLLMPEYVLKIDGTVQFCIFRSNRACMVVCSCHLLLFVDWGLWQISQKGYLNTVLATASRIISRVVKAV